MKGFYLRPLVAISIVLSCASSPAWAEPEQPEASTDEGVPGWQEFVDSLRSLPDRLIAKLPPEKRDDPQYRAEVGRLMLAAVTLNGLAALNGDGDHPAFVPLFGQVLDLARPNADTVYRSAEITPGGTYRLRGRQGKVAIARIGEAGARAGGGTGYRDLNALHANADGRYDVILSPERPDGYTGDWWRIHPGTNQLLLRVISNNWNEDEDPTFSIERLDAPTTRSRPSAAELELRLRRMPAAIEFLAGLRIGWISKLREQGYLHKFKSMDYSEAGLLAGQFYFEAAYDLEDDEALILETGLPERCVYRSLILTTEMGETIDWTNNHSSLNASQAKPDNDGMLRVVISANDPGVPNWLDTAGYAQGGIQGRWTDCTSQPVPSLRKVAHADLRKFLPAATPRITPSQREEIIRKRRAAFQQRPLW